MRKSRSEWNEAEADGSDGKFPNTGAQADLVPRNGFFFNLNPSDGFTRGALSYVRSSTPPPPRRPFVSPQAAAAGWSIHSGAGWTMEREDGRSHPRPCRGSVPQPKHRRTTLLLNVRALRMPLKGHRHPDASGSRGNRNRARSPGSPRFHGMYVGHQSQHASITARRGRLT